MGLRCDSNDEIFWCDKALRDRFHSAPHLSYYVSKYRLQDSKLHSAIKPASQIATSQFTLKYILSFVAFRIGVAQVLDLRCVGDHLEFQTNSKL